ncbi:hypothetical protein MTsPCn9_33560 [Croceitalea sp. MTPC9]|uniref:hypothetical protein n=1 Tax=unclassified Croceitalea TaxID=2632280 RepID=UPI002B378F1A|nr:hypothetical protein MTsPCn6_18470 [Croceitalea sp. MTPC6]GMN18416.1 hypothetical protein MTsPCn9_33560 [Croceitalea sp. MTPC9]
MNKQLHLAIQYLATAGKSFLEHRSDDSHTNVGFFIEDQTLRTWNLDDLGTYLAFSFEDFALQWSFKSNKTSFELDGKPHDEIVDWISKMATISSFKKSYGYDLHYDLPCTVSNDFKFELSNPKDLNQLLQLRILVQHVLLQFLSDEKLESDIRIWPHHLDTGAYVELNDGSGKSIGMGMAIPDSISNDHYFYMSGYRGHDSLKTDSFPKLTYGEWKNDTFKGAILPATSSGEETAVRFFKEAFKAFTD